MSDNLQDFENVQARVKLCIIRALDLEISADQLNADSPLFAPESVGGMGFDSLGALEIFVHLSKEFSLDGQDIDEKHFVNVRSLADWVISMGKA